MIKQGSGDIVNVSSIAGLQTYLGGSVYAATKHAIEAITNTLRKEVMKYKNIRVLSINPGLVETEFSIVRFFGDVEKAKKVYQGYKALEAADIADSIVYATSRKSHVQIASQIIFPTTQAAVDQVWKE